MQNHNLYRRLLVRFVNERANFANEFEKLLAVGEIGNALNQVHSLKLLVESLGMSALGAIAAEAAYRCRQYNVDSQRSKN